MGRRLKHGELEVEQHPTPQGFTWLVAMPASSGPADDALLDRSSGSDVSSDLSEESTATAEPWRLLEDERAEVLAANDAMIDRLADEVACLQERFD